ncbi:MAG: hypothetical protein PHE88_04440 [Elusimicrobia bacterium]|nr:hypothetical protein [Elusimicrobiota bacterium]
MFKKCLIFGLIVISNFYLLAQEEKQLQSTGFYDILGRIYKNVPYIEKEKPEYVEKEKPKYTRTTLVPPIFTYKYNQYTNDKKLFIWPILGGYKLYHKDGLEEWNYSSILLLSWYKKYYVKDEGELTLRKYAILVPLLSGYYNYKTSKESVTAWGCLPLFVSEKSASRNNLSKDLAILNPLIIPSSLIRIKTTNIRPDKTETNMSINTSSTDFHTSDFVRVESDLSIVNPLFSIYTSTSKAKTELMPIFSYQRNENNKIYSLVPLMLQFGIKDEKSFIRFNPLYSFTKFWPLYYKSDFDKSGNFLWPLGEYNLKKDDKNISFFPLVDYRYGSKGDKKEKELYMGLGLIFGSQSVETKSDKRKDIVIFPLLTGYSYSSKEDKKEAKLNIVAGAIFHSESVETKSDKTKSFFILPLLFGYDESVKYNLKKDNNKNIDFLPLFHYGYSSRGDKKQQRLKIGTIFGLPGLIYDSKSVETKTEKTKSITILPLLFRYQEDAKYKYIRPFFLFKIKVGRKNNMAAN